MEARLTSVVVYPFKGAAGIAVDAAEIRVTGLATGGIADREWMAVDRDGRFVSQREFPRLALVHPAMAMAKKVDHVLVLGGGDGLAVRELLKYSEVKDITLVDLDQGMTTLFKTNKILTGFNHNSLKELLDYK